MPVSKSIAADLSNASWIRKMFEEGARLKAQLGPENVYDFSLGNPILPPPNRFYEELKRIAASDDKSSHRYMPNQGYAETRAAIANRYAQTSHLPLTENHVVMTCGAGGALNVVLKALLDPGDQVVVLAPYFVEYGFYIKNAGGQMTIAETTATFDLDLVEIEKTLKPNTRAIIVNSPNNPTGKVYNKASLEGLNRLLLAHEQKTGHPIYVLSDEPYRKITYDNIEVPENLAIFNNGILISSHSKDLGLAGERIGYIVVSSVISDALDLIAGFVFCNRILGFVNAPALAQRLVAHLQNETVNMSLYRKNREVLLQGLADSALETVAPEGAFYAFPQVPGGDDVKFVKHLQRYKILTVPGRGFGREGHIRFSFCVPETMLTQAMPHLIEACSTYRDILKN
jgi:aspartate aminotransferase